MRLEVGPLCMILIVISSDVRLAPKGPAVCYTAFMQTTKTDTSYGVIPIRRVGNSWEVFLIHQYSRIGKNTYWALPKGHPEVGESQKETALRELQEETGMAPVTLLDKQTFSLAYSFFYDGQKIYKTVVFFVGVIEDDQPTLDPEEVKEAGWYSLEAAQERLDYRDMKTMFSDVCRFLEHYQ
jgi:bis(5'-nucleosidyl)-tetraphosphatase